ncbi:hypothetical protein O1C12_003284 [Vibrio cholerae]|nr:hypothetical protein [Vibrio cholerae]
MSKLKSLLITFSLLSGATQAFEFENTTCSIIKGQTDLSPIVVKAIKLGKVRTLTKSEADKYGSWTQVTGSMDYIDVEVFINDGKINRSLYRLVDGTLHQSFPSRDGQYTFRRIVPAYTPNIGRYDHVNINGSSLKSTLLNTISCEKNLF